MAVPKKKKSFSKTKKKEIVSKIIYKPRKFNYKLLNLINMFFLKKNQEFINFIKK